MLARRNLTGIDAVSMVIMGSDGHAYVMRRKHGSIRVSLSEMEKWAKKRIWWLEDVPGKAEGLIRSLNEAYERYLICKEQDLELTAGQWLVTADRLAGEVSDLVERGYQIPKAVIVYMKRPSPEPVRDPKKRRPAHSRKTRLESRQLTLFRG